MEITYLGHASFKIRGKEGVVVMDPFDPAKVGLSWNKPKADVVTVSHEHDDHNNVAGVVNGGKRQEIMVINGPGEYEVGGIMIRGWQTDHDDNKGQDRGRNTMYIIEMNRLTVLHCGDLEHELSQEMIEDIGEVDVMLVPVGGVYTIDAKTAIKVVKAVAPSYVVPMHYQIDENLPTLSQKLAGVDEFLKAWGKDGLEAQEKLVVSEGGLPEGTEVVLLKV
jgi:L-ascorbate metabolism protein UlaG (beta-lactamase superfamily)